MTEKIARPEQLISEIDQIQYPNQECYYDKCRSKPIQSHTISTKNLNKLNKDLKKVLTFEPAISSTVKQSLCLMKKVNQKKFSTFPGFCEEHDCQLFRPIDLFDGKINEEKAALIHYRNICYGINHINTQMLRCKRLTEKKYIISESEDAIDPEIQEIQKMIDTRFQQPMRRLIYCLSQHTSRKNELEKMIKSHDFSKIKFRYLSGSIENPIFSGRSSVALHPQHKQFSSLGYSYMPWISYMTLLAENENYAGNKNHLVFCWLKKDNGNANHLKKLLNNDFKKIIEVLAFGYSDAFAITKDFYKKHFSVIDEINKKLRTR